MSGANSLLTAAEFSRMADPGHPQELVRGIVVNMPPPKPRHGKICGRIIAHLVAYCDASDLGHVLGNDSGVVTEQDPDTVRGPDVTFIGYAKLPRDADLDDYVEIAPDAVFEVRSPSDGWSKILRMVAEYLQLGVLAVYVFDSEMEQVHCYYPDKPEQILTAADELAGVGPLAGFRVPVAKFFA
ncbi:MAG TPA: Uma2 family endonuclease [Pirellulaceae bacterium]|nr:Uma2 family endonuclease [Pirellulaceae bacterium]